MSGKMKFILTQSGLYIDVVFTHRVDAERFAATHKTTDQPLPLNEQWFVKLDRIEYAALPGSAFPHVCLDDGWLTAREME